MKKKIILLFLSLFLVFLAGVFVTLYMIFQTTANLDSLITLHKVEIIRQELVISVQTVQSNLYTSGTLFGKELDVIVDNVGKLTHGVQRCGSCHHEPEVDRGINTLQELTGQYREALSYYITSTADQERVERLQAVAADIGDTIIAKSQEMALTANDSLHRKTVAATTKVNQSKRILAFTILLAFFISAVIAIYLIRSIARPVSALLDATRRIRTGELGYTSSYEGHDEFRELIDSFNDMSKILKGKNEEILGQMARNQTILETATDGFLLFDETGRILDVNPALCEMAEYSAAELRRMKFTDLEVLGSRFASNNVFKRIREAGSLLFQAQQKTKSGRLVMVEINATFTEMENTGNFFCFIRDITERKKTEEELLKVQKLESLGVLAGGIAHDFNNLLTGILGNIDLALLRLNPNDKIHSWLTNAKKASGRAQNLTQQLLTFSRGGEPVRQPMPLPEMIEESARFVLSGSNVRCRYQLASDLGWVNADRGQLSQVIQNIILNANQAMPEGGSITVRAENVLIDDSAQLQLSPGLYVKISFADEGIGIHEKHLAKIFDPYFSTKQTGSGLGLTICYSIISKHDGLLYAESKPGFGSTFTIYLPAIPRENLSATTLREDSIATGTGKVLVMDDEEHVREIAAEMLKSLGYESEFARDGAEAIAMYQQALAAGQPYAVVIMDLTIPGGMGGKEAITKLLEIDPQVKAVVSSGYSFDPIMADHRKYGFSGVVAKPYDVSQLSKTLAEIRKRG